MVRWTRLPEIASATLSISSVTDNKQFDTVLPDDITNEHLENKKAKISNSTSKKQSKLASNIDWGRYSSFSILTRHVARIIKKKPQLDKVKKCSTHKRKL